MSPRYLLDTNIVSYHLRRSSPGLRQRLAAERVEHFALSVVTEMEIRYGLARNPGLRIAPLVEAFLAAIAILPMDSTVARRYGLLRAEMEELGRGIGPLDLMIAAHALSLDLTLITGDLGEFRRVPGLRCENWS